MSSGDQNMLLKEMVLKNLEDGLILIGLNHLLKMNLKELKNLVRNTTIMDLIRISFLIM